MNTKKFSELNISKEVLKATDNMGFEIAMPIQAQAIPPLLEGKDVIGQAMTGTGKTVAFAIPAIESINPRLKKPQVLILCPTRELAIQVAVEVEKLAQFKDGIYELPIYGGQPISRQLQALRRGPQIIIGTPGRVLDHLNRKSLKLDSVTSVILDEADEMLNMGFVQDIETILTYVPQKRQTVLFSATMSKAILALTQKYQTNPTIIKIEHEKLSVPKITQEYFEINRINKLDLLLLMLEEHNPWLTIIFCNTKRMVDKLIINLRSHGHAAEGLHGDMAQAKRSRIMESFRSGKTTILVATDVAARGIDVDDVEMVFNYDIPVDEEYYVHRIGRTGRAGKTGRAYTFVLPREMHMLKGIERYTKTQINRGKEPGEQELLKLKTNSTVKRIMSFIKKNNLDMYKGALEQALSKDVSWVDVAAALFKMQCTPDNKQDDARPQRSEGRGMRKAPSSKRQSSQSKRPFSAKPTHRKKSPNRSMFKNKKRDW